MLRSEQVRANLFILRRVGEVPTHCIVSVSWEIGLRAKLAIMLNARKAREGAIISY